MRAFLSLAAFSAVMLSTSATLRPVLAAEPTQSAKPVAQAAEPATATAKDDGKAAAVEDRASTPAKAASVPRAKSAAASTTLVARIDLTNQRMTVSYNGSVQHSWLISSGREGYYTPRGSFRPQWTAKMWYSRKYDNAPMPHSVFFVGGVAVHATQALSRLGQPASHGCIRLAPANAAKFYSLVHKHGLKRTSIQVFGTTPPSRVARTSRPASQTRKASNRRERNAGTASAMSWTWGPPPRQAGAGAVTARQPRVRRAQNGTIYIPKGHAYRGRDSFVLNGVRYVRVR